MENETSNNTAIDYNEIGLNIYREKIFYINKLHEIGFYLLLVTVPLGIIGNLVSIFIFTRPRLNRKTNTGFFYTILCIFNLIKILYQAIFKRWDNYLEYNIKLHFYCEFLIENLISQILSWIQVLTVFDRFIVVFSPIKGVRTMAKKWVLYSIMFGLLALIFCANSPYFIRHSISITYDFSNDTYYETGIMSAQLTIINAILRLLMEVYIPYFIIVALDILVVVRLRRSKTNFVNSNARKQTGHNRASRFTINTILIDFIYLIVYFPFTLCKSFVIINLYNPSMFNTSFIFVFITRLFDLLPFIYSSFILVIFISFNRNFRSEFFSIGLLVKFKYFLNAISEFSQQI